MYILYYTHILLCGFSQHASSLYFSKQSHIYLSSTGTFDTDALLFLISNFIPIKSFISGRNVSIHSEAYPDLKTDTKIEQFFFLKKGSFSIMTKTVLKCPLECKNFLWQNKNWEAFLPPQFRLVTCYMLWSAHSSVSQLKITPYLHHAMVQLLLSAVRPWNG